MWTIYMHKNKINGMVYIGQTEQKNPEVRWANGHGYKQQKLFFNNIIYYGWINFEHSILETNIKTQEEANEKEQYYISKYKSNEVGYNQNIGGSGVVDWRRCWYQWEIDLIVEIDNKLSIEEVLKLLNKKRESYKLKPRTMDSLQATRVRLIKENKLTNQSMKKVICIETQKIYESATEAGRDTCANCTTINACCMNIQKTSGGYHWAYVNDKERIEELKCYIGCDPHNFQYKKVICIETNRVYNSITEAEKDTNISSTSICNCCQGIQKTASGYHWVYADDKEKIEELKCFKNCKPQPFFKRKVICIETNKIYDSMKEAEKDTNISYKCISNCCRGARKTAGGLHWKYVD